MPGLNFYFYLNNPNMDYRDLTEKDYKAVFDSFKFTLEHSFGLKTEVKKLNISITGDFNGIEILVRDDLPQEMKLFILAHLFGHTIQFNTSQKLRKLGMTQFGPHNVSEKILRKIKNYESDASRYALQLFHDLGIHTLDQWISDWVAADWHYLSELYTSGEKSNLSKSFILNFKSKYLTYGTPPLTPLAIPPFTPQKWESRYAF
jgi:hypothetical protein